jgi:hypothetical protein
LSIVSIICDTCAQTAMDWAPSDSK